MTRCKEFAERAVRHFVCPANICKPLCADSLGGVGKLVYLFARICARGIFGNNCLNNSACFDCIFENGKVCFARPIGDVLNKHIKAGVGLVGAVSVHRLFKGHPFERSFNIDSYCFFHKLLNKALSHLHNVLGVNKAHFKVDLRKFGLAVRS